MVRVGGLAKVDLDSSEYLRDDDGKLFRILSRFKQGVDGDVDGDSVASEHQYRDDLVRIQARTRVRLLWLRLAFDRAVRLFFI